MAKLPAFKDLSPDEVAGLSPKVRAKYDAWLEAQDQNPGDTSDDNESADEEEQPAETPVADAPKGIVTQEQAEEHLAKNYVVPEEVKSILITQDGNVFYDGNVSGGIAHAQRFELKMFRVYK